MKKTNSSTSHNPGLHDLIEIIRDPQPPSSAEIALPSDSDDSNPFNALNQLVERLDALVCNQLGGEPRGTTTDIERYIELVQKQSAVLRRVLGKLN